MTRCFLLTFICGSIAFSARAATNLFPVAVTGFNRDLVVEATAVGPPFTAYASEMNAGEGKANYQTGLPTYAWGLPPSGTFVSDAGDGTIWQFQPYTTNNALVLSPDTGLTSGTLTLVTPATYAKIAIMAHSGSGTNQTGPVTFTFNDNSTYTTTYYAPDWFGGSGSIAWFGAARINLTTGADEGGTQNPRFYTTTINLASVLGTSNKPLVSLTFGKAVANSTAIYAVSGQLAVNATASGGPIAVTGFNHDLVIEHTASGPPYNAYAQSFAPTEGNVFYESGLPGTTNGLPQSGSFNSAIDGTLFQFQPYTSSNALVMSTNTGINRGTLTLTTPAVYNSISLIANSDAGGGTPNMTLNFSDGSSFTTNYNAPDWFNNNGAALLGVERISLSGTLSGAPGNPRFYQTSVDLLGLFGATNKPLASVTFNQAAGAAATAIYALSGVRTGLTNFALATVTNAPATGIQPRAATVGATVVSSNDVPVEFIYYGTTDGGTNAAAWSQRVSAGAQKGSFAQVLSGLSVGTTYYYTVVAVNSAGTVWATPSLSFTTATPSSATVTNLPAANVTTNSALLSGQVLAAGGDAPTITLFYGPSNGGTNPAAWASSASLGIRVGQFAQNVTGLSANTTYYFVARAVNAAGAAWGTPALSFTTPLTNPPASLVSVLTYRNDNTRNGQNTNETILTPANVNTNTFGKLFSYALDGTAPSQPLVMANVTIPGKGVHNVVFAATEHNSVYAFDADSNAGANAVPLWQVSFINPAAGITTVSATGDLASIAGGFVGPELGISGTPVIDPASGTLYVVAITKEIVNNTTNFYNKLHALDVGTGAEKFGGPVLIQGSVPGIGDGNDGNENVPFVQLKHHQRQGLVLNNGQLFVSFSGHFDYPPYHGWVFAFDPHSLQQTGIWNANPNGSGGGFWQAGCAPAADAAGNLYLESGNGNFDAPRNSFGDCLVKLSTTNGLALADYFAPFDQLAMNLADLDLGSAGQILLPDSAGSVAHPHLLVGTGKNGTLYLIDRDNLGQFHDGSDSQIVQAFTSAVGGMWSTPGWFNGTLYCIGVSDRLKAFSVSNAVINTTAVGQGPATIAYPGASPCISANGTSNAIVWALQTSGTSILHAYNATNVSQELYNSSLVPGDAAGSSVKWSVPTVANGKVYVVSTSALQVYANLVPAPIITPAGGVFTNSIMVTISNTAPGASIYYTLDGTVPSTNSILYTGAFTLTGNAGVQAVAFLPGPTHSLVTSATFLNSSSLGTGAGLLGQYYANTIYTNPFVGSPLVRTDATINFNWNSVSPDPSIPSANYTIRWSGLVQPLFNETYTFYTTTDDGVRLWVNGQLLIDHWIPQSPTTWGGSITLQAQHLYTIELEYFQAGGGAVAQLAWSSPSTAQAIVPQSQLYPLSGVRPVFTAPGSFTNGNFDLRVAGLQGKSYIFQGSTDFVNWISISTNVAPGNFLDLVDPNASSFPRRFYRAIQLP